MLTEGIKTVKFVKNLKKYKSSTDEITRKKTLLYLRQSLGQGGGILLKALQYMGTKNPEVDEIIYSKEENVNLGLSKNEVIDLISKRYNIKKVFKSITDEAFPASVGQVQKAYLQNGEVVALKVQYPKIKSIFKSQVKMLSLIPKISNKTSFKKWRIDFDSYLKQTELILNQECNYLYEIEHLKNWEKFLESDSSSFVPKVYDEYSYSDMYIQEYINGDSFSYVKSNWSDESKIELAHSMLFTYFNLLLNHNVAQGDTNLGNFLFSVNDGKVKVTFIDLGQAINFNRHFCNSLKSAFINELSSHSYSKYQLLIDLGFNQDKLENISSKVDQMVDILFSPIKSNNFDFSKWDYKDKLEILLGDEKWWFRSAGGKDFFLFMKSFLGLKNMLIQLNVNIDVSRQIQKCIERDV